MIPKLLKLAENLNNEGLTEVMLELAASDLNLYYSEIIKSETLTREEKESLGRFFTSISSVGKYITDGYTTLINLLD